MIVWFCYMLQSFLLHRSSLASFVRFLSVHGFVGGALGVTGSDRFTQVPIGLHGLQ